MHTSPWGEKAMDLGDGHQGPGCDMGWWRNICKDIVGRSDFSLFWWSGVIGKGVICTIWVVLDAESWIRLLINNLIYFCEPPFTAPPFDHSIVIHTFAIELFLSSTRRNSATFPLRDFIPTLFAQHTADHGRHQSRFVRI